VGLGLWFWLRGIYTQSRKNGIIKGGLRDAAGLAIARRFTAASRWQRQKSIETTSQAVAGGTGDQ